MRLDEMVRTHPEQVTGKCCTCGKPVGIYPSGQKVLRLYPGNVEVVCNHCGNAWGARPAPGALDEARRK